MASHKRKVDTLECTEDESVVDDAIHASKKQIVVVSEEEEAKHHETALVLVNRVTSVVAVPVAQEMPVDNLFLDYDNPKSIDVQFGELYLAFANLMKRGVRVKVRNPDLAMALASTKLNMKLSLVELTQKQGQFLVSGPNQGYMNFRRKEGQRDFSGDKLRGYNFVSAAFVPKYFNQYGNTVATGVEGTRGKVVTDKKGKKHVTKAGEEKYEWVIGCAPIHPNMIDKNSNNPMSLWFMQGLDLVKEFAWETIWANPSAMLDMRKFLANQMGAEAAAKLTAAEARAVLLKAEKYLDKVKVDKEDPTAFEIATAESCYRQPRKDWKTKVYTESINPADHEFPSDGDMFRKNFAIVKEDGETKYNIWNPRPVWRWRRPNEMKEGVKYASPWIPIPPENVHITNKDIVFELTDLNFYEYSARGETSFQHGFGGLVWLNTVDEMAKILLEDVEPCDPLAANPFAGYYRGPQGWEGEPPADWKAQEEARVKMQAAQDEDDDAAMVEAADAAEASIPPLLEH